MCSCDGVEEKIKSGCRFEEREGSGKIEAEVISCRAHNSILCSTSMLHTYFIITRIRPLHSSPSACSSSLSLPPPSTWSPPPPPPLTICSVTPSDVLITRIISTSPPFSSSRSLLLCSLDAFSGISFCSGLRTCVALSSFSSFGFST